MTSFTYKHIGLANAGANDRMLSFPPFGKIAGKIGLILTAYFLIAITAIGLTLRASWQLEGGGAAINDAGSERMRSYQIAYWLAQPTHDARAAREVKRDVLAFGQVLDNLERGDPSRPLALPRNAQVQTEIHALQQRWHLEMRPRILKILDTADPARKAALIQEFHPHLVSFVAAINRLVFSIEHSNTRNTALLRAYQFGLIALAIAGTVALLYLFYLLVVRPVSRLQEGITRMSQADFSMRLPVETRDEFGDLATGFNRMADHLEDLYATLERRVQEKTERLEEKNQELSALYEITAYLNEPSSAEQLAQGVLRLLEEVFAADAASLRLADPANRNILMFVHDGLSEEFIRAEHCLGFEDCLCGESVRKDISLTCDLVRESTRPTLPCCREAGFAMVSMATVRFRKQAIGLINLYFRAPRPISEREQHLLQTVGQHVGVAIQNQRLVLREKEMAVSEERNLLAQELHDSIAQSLAFLNIEVQLLMDSLRQEEVADALLGAGRIREGIQESYDDVRELLVHFRTRYEHGDLESAIRHTLERFEGQTGIHTVFRTQGVGSPLKPEHVIQVMHVIQEALSNVRKHSAATEVEVLLQRDKPFSISVQDNGSGFQAAGSGQADEDNHVGLKIMRERAHRIGGRLEIHSQPAAGTLVSLHVEETTL